MDTEAFTREAKMTGLREVLLTVEENRLHYNSDITVDALDNELNRINDKI